MRKIVLILFILASARVAVYSQNNNSYNNGDDVYYYDDNNNTSNDNNVQQQDDNAPTYQTFYDELSPYGQWVSYPGYGYVWVPNQEPGTVFQPYLTGGHWVYTNYGWTWVSDYAWGWGPFHYGRWLYDAFYGWLWVPGYDWAPAWVVWGDYGGYYCWAPIEPGVVINTHYRPDWHRWYCVPHENITQQEPVHYLVNNDIALKGHQNDVSVFTHAGSYNQSVFFTGPKASDVEKTSGHTITRVKVVNAPRAEPSKVQGNEVNIYRPDIKRTNAQPAPKQVKPAQEVSPKTAPQQTTQPKQENRVIEQPQQNWTAPRQAPQNFEQQRAPVQPQMQQPRQAPVERNFVPSVRPAQPAPQPQQHFQQPQQHFSAPQQHFSAPQSAPVQRAPGGRR